MEGALQPEAGPTLLPTPDLTWDELESFVDGLLERLQRMPGASPRLTASSRYGRGGDDQEGIDHYGTYDDGSTSTWQCRARVALGRKSVEKIIEETEVEATRHIIVFGRKASADARKELRDHPTWEIWDQRDLTNKVRALPTHEGRALLDDHFGKQIRHAVLPAADTDAFIGLDDYFRPLLAQDRVFHHCADLLGRTEELRQLSAALIADAGPKVTIISGPGGRGKSRIALEALRLVGTTQPQRPVVVRAGRQSLHADALSELRGLPAAILVEDAQHDGQGLDAVLNYTRRIAGAQVLATCRPTATATVREAALLAGFDHAEVLLIDLDPLGLDAARDLVHHLAATARLTLREDFAHALAAEGRDCPLVPVVAVSMLASGSLKTAALSLDRGFRQQILDRFGDVMRTGIPGLPSAQAVEILALFAALAPVNLDDDALLDSMSAFLGVSRTEFLGRAQALTDHGVLLERQGTVRVIVDILADEILARAAVRLGRDSGYVDRLWAGFGHLAFVALTYNLAELDRRLRSMGEGPDLFANIWAGIESEVCEADAVGRRRKLPLLRDLAGPQPIRVVHLAEILIEQPAAEAERWPGRLDTDADVRAGLAPVIGISAATGDSVRGKALDLLWMLARTDHRPPNQFPEHPLRILADFVEFGRPGGASRQKALIEAATRWLGGPGSDSDSVTPLAILEPLVAKEGIRQQPQPGGDALTFIPFLVSPTAVSDLRADVRALAAKHAVGTDVRRAIAAVSLLTAALTEPHGYFGNEVAAEHVRQWHDDDMATLDALAIVAQGTAEPLVRLQVRDTLSWMACNSKDEQLALRARSIIAAIDQRAEDLLSSAILSSFRDLVPRGTALQTGTTELSSDEAFAAATLRHEEERRDAALALWGKFPDAAAVVAHLDERLRAAKIGRLRSDGAGPVVEALCSAQPEQSEALLHAIRIAGEGPLDEFVHIPLEALRRYDETAFLHQLDLLLEARETTATGALGGFRSYDWLTAIPNTGERLVRALSSESDAVCRMAVHSAGPLLRQSPAQAAEKLIPLASSNSYAVIWALSEAARHNYDTWLDILSRDEQAAVLQLLVAARQWGEWQAQQLLARCAARQPSATLKALIAETGVDGVNLAPLAGLAEALDKHADAIHNAIATMLGTEERYRYALRSLIPSILGSPVTAGAAKALKALARTADSVQLVRLGELLQDCESLVPSQPTVVESMLERAIEHGQETHGRIRALLLNSAVPAVDASWGDEPPPKWVHLHAQAIEYAVCESLSPATRDFYAAVVGSHGPTVGG